VITSGQTIGGYRILAKIGTGGMGAVYMAEHPQLGQKVALKVIHHELASNREVVQRFHQEAHAVNKIGNEHIVTVHDFGQSPEGDFYVMEYLEGKTLAHVLHREGMIEVVRALHIGAQLAAALGAAHVQGIIHRDLKPDNVMLVDRRGDPDYVKVLDFGLAKVFAANGAPLTAVGVLLGTPQYMSPEACESNGALDNRTDIYALGVLLFQMMTGKLPFDGKSMGEVLIKQVRQLPPAPRGFNPAIPPSVEQILLRCLAKPRDGRFPTMQALREALLDPEGYLSASPPISAARSVAPGEAGIDARAVVAYAAAQQARKASGKTGPSPVLPAGGLDAPGGSGVSGPHAAAATGPDVPAEPQNRTMIIATPMGYRSAPPPVRRAWPIVLVAGLLLGLGGGGFALAWFGRRGPVVGGGAAGAVRDSASAAPVGAPTTPSGGGGSLGVDDAGGSAAARGATAGVVANAGGGDASVGGDADIGVDGGAAPPPAAPAATDPATPGRAVAARTAQVSIDSVPSGAEVWGGSGRLGVTPLVVPLPIGPTSIELRLAGHKPRQKQINVTDDMGIELELEVERPAGHRSRPAASGRPAGTPAGKPAAAHKGDGLMSPDDL
jgi:serine/threonine-protein kinase